MIKIVTKDNILVSIKIMKNILFKLVAIFKVRIR